MPVDNVPHAQSRNLAFASLGGILFGRSKHSLPVEITLHHKRIFGDSAIGDRLGAFGHHFRRQQAGGLSDVGIQLSKLAVEDSME